MVVSKLDSGGDAINVPPPDTEKGDFPMQDQLTTPASREEWRSAPGYEGLYDVSNLGRVRSYLRPGHHKVKKAPVPRIMSESVTKGYKTVALTKDGRYRSYRVHRLVLQAFAGPCPAQLEAAHINGDHHDNRIANLAWMSHQENESHKKQHGTDPKGERNGLAKLAEWEVIEIKYLLSKGIPQAKLARLFDISPTAIKEIASGHRWGHVPTRTLVPQLVEALEEAQGKLKAATRAWGDRDMVDLDRILKGEK